MQMMLDGDIESSEYKTIKNRYEEQNASLTRQKFTWESADSNFMKYVKGGITQLKNIDKYYKEVGTPMKQKIIGSILEEKLVSENCIY